MTIKISTSQYQFAHGKKPRGIGTWGFYLRNSKGQEKLLMITGRYSVAGQKAVRIARLEGFSEIVVGS